MKAIFLVPLYDIRDHFDRALELVKSYPSSEEIAFIFSSQDQLDKFKGLLGDTTNVTFLLLSEEWLGHKNQIHVKKLVGSNMLFDKGYDFVAVVDAESLFIKPVNTLELCKEIWKHPLIGNLPSGTASVMLSATIKVSGISKEKVKKHELGKYYFWFNEIPVYEKKTFKLFWKWLFNRKGYDPIPAFQEVNSFDHTLYAFFLIIHGFKKPKIINIQSNLYGLLEEFPSRGDLNRVVVLEEMGTHWCKWPINYVSDFDNKPRIKMLFNMGRDPFGEAHGYNWGYWR
jgi:hypothetical protein